MKLLPHSQLSRPTRRKLIKSGLIAAPSVAVGLRSKRADAAFASFMAHSGTPLRHNVVTTSFPLSNHANTTLKAMSVQPYMAQSAMTTVQIVLVNCYGPPEVAVTGTTTFTAAIQDASNNFTQITFSGSSSGATTAKYLVSDEVTLVTPITAGAMFNMRIFASNPAGGMAVMVNGFPPGGAGYDYGGTASDSTMSNTSVVQTYEGSFYCASVIATRHNSKAVAAYGDSICYGTGMASNVVPFWAPRTGVFSSIGGPNYGGPGFLPFANLGVPSDTLQNFITSNGSVRRALGAWFSSFATNYGVNDFNNGRTSTQVQADMTTMIGQMSTHGPLIVGTVSPSGGTSTNDFADNNPANQTPAGYNSQRATYCDWIRTLPKFIDTAAALEIAVNDGKWKAGFTDASDPWDGIHPTGSGYAAAAAIVDISVFS
jgi:lysophospholipase L1-like esterase